MKRFLRILAVAATAVGAGTGCSDPAPFDMTPWRALEDARVAGDHVDSQVAVAHSAQPMIEAKGELDTTGSAANDVDPQRSGGVSRLREQIVDL